MAKLEQRVASLLVEISRLETTSKQETLIRAEFDKEILSLQMKVRQQYDELTNQKIDNQTLKFEIAELTETVVSQTSYERIQSQLQLAETEIVFKDGKIN